MGTITTLLKIKADTRSAVSGLKPLQSSLDQTAKDAQATEKSLNELDGTHRIRVEDDAVANARREITRLRNQMREDLRLDVTADTRETQRRIKQLQSSVKTLDAQKASVTVTADTADAESGIRGVAGSLRGLAAGVGIGAIAKGFFEASMASSDFETSMRGLNTILGETTATGLETWIAENADALNLSEAAAADAARGLSLYARSAESAGADAQKFTEDLIRVAAEAAAFSGQDPAEAASAIGAAMRGEFDSLERFGINLTADRLAAYALANGLSDAEGNMTQGQKALAAYNLILEDSASLMGSTERNADTLGGSMSDLKQKTGDLAQVIGDDLGAALADVAGLTSEVAGGFADILEARREFVDESSGDDGFGGLIDNLKTLTTGGLGDLVGLGKKLVIQGKDLFAHGNLFWSENQKRAAEEAEAATKDMADEIEAGQKAAAEAAAEHAAHMLELAEAVESTGEEYQNLLDVFSAVNTAMVESRTSIYDYEGALDDLADSLKEGTTFAPDAEQGRANWDALVQLGETASERIKNVLSTRGAAAANQVYLSTRESMFNLLTEAGIKAPQAWKLIDQVLKKPHKMRLELDETDRARLQNKLAKLEQRKAKITASVDIPDSDARNAARRAMAALRERLTPVNAKIQAVTEQLETPKGELADLANPGGKPRDADIKPKVDPASQASAKSTLDLLAQDRYTTIHVTTVGGPGVNAPSSAPGGRPTPLAPRQQPSVNVYVDGKNIPARADTPRGSGRRVA